MSQIKLVSITPDAEELLMYCARVSNPSNQDSKNKRLLAYCAENGHWSVFEMANMVLEINTSRAIARQILRHRSFSFQEFSQRYADVQELAKQMIINQARRQDTKNRQNSIADMDKKICSQFETDQLRLNTLALNMYQDALDKGIAKECARVFLPEGCTPSRLYMNGNIRSWIHYCQLRCSNGTQLEHSLIADQIKQVLIEQVPSLEGVFK